MHSARRAATHAFAAVCHLLWYAQVQFAASRPTASIRCSMVQCMSSSTGTGLLPGHQCDLATPARQCACGWIPWVAPPAQPLRGSRGRRRRGPQSSGAPRGALPHGGGGTSLQQAGWGEECQPESAGRMGLRGGQKDPAEQQIPNLQRACSQQGLVGVPDLFMGRPEIGGQLCTATTAPRCLLVMHVGSMEVLQRWLQSAQTEKATRFTSVPPSRTTVLWQPPVKQ